ncbi:HAD-IC family P-type ATPase [Acuticoccus sp. M5D2P5]|uniref:cation-translocating P-type ATPase n=1 Tax=Acuticoccus kalidii TaxID=2910977 RepID=UPI001F483DA9|nr:HAD-IC family P-type ATPase [Acuticoccus kalidii]MCF3932175.1 HAD-IC family P-type ATPase [Acuticoccus kalidii]
MTTLPATSTSEANRGDRRTAWHSIDAATVLDDLATSPRGLTAAEVETRRRRYGPNALPETARRSRLARLAAQFNNVLIYVLLGAAFVTLLLGHVTDMVVILAVVLLNAAIGYWQEGRAEDALAAVRGMLSETAEVIRAGERSTVAAADLVPGDIVHLEPGSRVPADLRIIEARGLTTQEAALTGEAMTVVKSVPPVAEDAPLGDRTSLAFSGTMVTSGRGTGVVVATGQAAEIGRIGAMLGDIEELSTPLLDQINRFAKWLTMVILSVSAVVFLVAVFLRDYPLDEGFMAMVGMAVAAIPEGLPAVITITMALGVQRMANRNATVRRLTAVETLGAVSVICTDKTGTLTMNEMVARSLVTHPLAPPTEVSGTGYAPEGTIEGDETPARARLIRAGLLCNDAHLRQEGDGRWEVAGDPLEGALVSLARKAGLDPARARAAMPRLDEVPFDAANRYMATLNRTEDGNVVLLKGALDQLLTMCADQAAADGAEPLDANAWLSRMETLAADGQRVLAFAEKRVGADEAIAEGAMKDGFTLLGIVGFTDPPRPEAIVAARDALRAGVAVKMITGDHAATALAIADQLGIDITAGALTGREIDEMDDQHLRGKAGKVDVFARAAPEHKLRLVEALQAEGNVVVMTGDGVNDAPALKRADVGVAMGITGTDAAKDASRVVLADDNFATIVAAVREGRAIYDNIKKVIAWTLPTNGGESLVITGAILAGVILPITALQILWINLVTAIALGLTLAFEPPEETIMERPPRARNAALLDAEMIWRVVFVSVLMALGTFGVFFLAIGRGDDVAYARTLAVNVIVVMEIFYLFSVRYLHLTSLTFVGVVGTRAVLIGVALTTALQFAFTYVPFLQRVFDSRPVVFADGLLVVGIGVALLLVLEVEKFVRRSLGRRIGRRGATRPA